MQVILVIERRWNNIKKAIAWVIILVGLGVLLYNLYFWYDQLQNKNHDPERANALATGWQDKSEAPSLQEGTSFPEVKSAKAGDQVGELIIPSLDGLIVPIVKDTDENSLSKGIGLYQGYGTVSPGETGHTVLSGHRDTVLQQAGDLKIGDKIYVKMRGKMVVYQIRKTWITDKDDRTVIVPDEKPILSLTTCYPFDYVGNAPDRYIIRAELIDIKDTSTTS
ncbi:class D sortase [Hazenella sp. IB182357]|uniref:Class D sortase n=1 Tax=Polycladospora coralii TaxID=2771432 RepID=A0A926RT13_9BACL|nr:class D sortase [Polycladospora coralii]MBD1372225.1 class D sortase [Polycladospora coralii]MBS7530724.1 class D sortase [Polycladospora coralii]